MLSNIESEARPKIGPRLEKRLKGKRPVIEAAVNTVAQTHDINPDDIFGLSRKADIARARHVAAYVLFVTDPSISYRTVALGLGRNDHTTIINSVMRVEELMREDQDFRKQVEGISREVANFKPAVS